MRCFECFPCPAPGFPGLIRPDWQKLLIQQKLWRGFAHLFRPTYPDFLHGAPPTAACAAFIKASRMKVANASKRDRKSAVHCGERGAPVQFPRVSSTPAGENLHQLL